MVKSKLRKIYLTRQKSLIDSERIERSLKITKRFFSNFDLKDIWVVHTFISIEKNREVDTSFIVNKLWDSSWKGKICAPRLNPKFDIIESVEYNERSKLITNNWGIFEPSNGEIIDDKKIDLVIVPLLCFDKKGFRVGYGKGYYDKFLINCRESCLKIGLSFFEPINEIEDVKGFDVGLNYCITPKTTYKWRRNS